MINKIKDTLSNQPDSYKKYSFMRKTEPTVTGVRSNNRETIYSLSTLSTYNPVFKATPLKDVFVKEGFSKPRREAKQKPIYNKYRWKKKN